MLHTDFVSNLCLFSSTPSDWTAVGKKTVCNACCGQQVADGDPCKPLLLTRMEHGAEPAPHSVITVHPKRFFLTQKGIAPGRSVAPGFRQLAPASCIRGSCVLRVRSSRTCSGRA